MKTVYNIDEDCNLVKVKLMDNSDWEYDRMGLGECEGRVFMVDLDDSGEQLREMEYMKEGLSIQDILKIGCDVGVFEEIDWGYGDNDKFRYNWENDGTEAWNRFRKLVK